MVYEKHIWETGQVITAEKLNNIQDCLEELNGDIEVPGSVGRVVTINVDGYERSLSSDSVIINSTLYDTIDNLFQKYDAVFLEYSEVNESDSVTYYHRDCVITKAVAESSYGFVTADGLNIVATAPSSGGESGGGGEIG